MANYIPYYGKKRYRLAVHESEFAALLRTETNVSRLGDAAEKVRAAHVRALKAIRAQLPPSETHAVAVEKLDREIQFWIAVSAAEVIDGYQTGRFRAVPQDAVRRSRR
jgi:hypothetical protein